MAPRARRSSCSTPAQAITPSVPGITEMRPGAVLINASHAGLVDNGAVIGAVRSGRLAGALLDLEELTQEELDDFRERYLALAKGAREQRARGERDTGTPEPP